MNPTAQYDVSIVTAVYDVARYLPEFFTSLEKQQGVDLGRIQVVAVDDGSTDDSLEVLTRYQQEFARRGILPMTVLTQENAGQGPARNNGIGHATGEWLTFVDPDDTLATDYLAQVLGFVGAHPDVEMVGTAYWIHDDATGEISDTHPLRARFTAGDRLVDLDSNPDLFFGSANAAFFRRSHIEERAIEFDGRIRPNFEDGHFCVLYLLACDKPLVGFVGSAHYFYRKRSDGTSTLQLSTMQPGRYTVVPRLGYLDVLRRGAERSGRAPEWVQSIVLYELSWFFSTHAGASGVATAAVGDVAVELVEILGELRQYLEDEVVESFRSRWLDPAWRQILLHGVTGETWHSEYAVLDRVDPEQRLARVVVRWTGAEPAVQYLCDGVPTEPTHTKVRSFVFFEHALLHERISWVPADLTTRVQVDGRLVELRRWWQGAARTTFDTAPAPRRAGAPRTERPSVWHTARRLAAGATKARAFEGAWVLMDRLGDADDNGERLFEYLRENRPDINAWFVIEAGTPDHERLAAGRHGDRVVPHGTPLWEQLMLHCEHLISSHIDIPVHRPPAIMALLGTEEPPWRFSFLQHGVIKDDLSGWLNPKNVDLFVVSTPDEYESVAGDGSSYVYTSRETKLTGLPRFDRLRRIARSLTPEDRNLVLVAPTWRHWLQKPRDRTFKIEFVDDFFTSEYVEQWFGLLRSPELAETMAAHGLQIGFLPHPNLQPVLPKMDLPDHVQPLTFAGSNVQRLFASAAVLVTDYSSMAFNSAYVDRPVVYFQFDHDRVMAGGHLGRAGYFKYPTHGFGPVARTLPDAVGAISEIIGNGCTPAPLYARRIEEAFVLRDGRCCERVTAEIEKLGLPSERPAPRALALSGTATTSRTV